MINKLCKYQKVIALFLLDFFLAQTLMATEMSYPSANPIKESAHQFLDNRPFFIGPVHSDTPSNEITITQKGVDDRDGEQQAPFIGGPGQPEMTSFKSVNSNNMVDLFTGDFSYNIPLLDVGGYPVSIHYNSGISMDQEASWVGLGWNVNPGVISRSARGLPDDFNGKDSITRIRSMKQNKTIGATLSADLEVLGRAVNFNIGTGVFHNTYNGWGTETFVNASINAGRSQMGVLTGSLGISNNSQSGLNVQPSLGYRIGQNENEWNGNITVGTNYNSRAGISALQLNTEVRTGRIFETNNRYAQPYIGFGMPSSISFATPSYLPGITMPITTKQISFKLKIGVEAWGAFSSGSVLGYASTSEIAPKDTIQKLPAYGYLYFSKNKSLGSLLDFNREKDVAYNEKTTPHIAIPRYTYDVYSISGEGITGSFRPYRGDIGYVYDAAISTKSKNERFSAELGFGTYFHSGADFDHITSITKTGQWTENNEFTKNISFSSSDTTFEEVYFRNPGEKSINATPFYSKFGSDSLVQVKLSGEKANIKAESVLTRFSKSLSEAGEVHITSPVLKEKRDKRSQVITYLTAGDASRIALDPVLKAYAENSNPVLDCDSIKLISRVGRFRKGHHLSEIDVLNPDGKRYVYGLPAYNLSQEDVVFSVGKNQTGTDADNGLTAYAAGVENSAGNDSGKDGYYTRDLTPAYAHSFLLTGILSPDYVDVSGDGITEDDPGDAIKFNYTQVYGDDKPFGWRTPMAAGKANYNEGLKTYNRDDKATYIYGTKEVWYLNSIESKTMIALFKISDRDDVYSANESGVNAGDRLKKLDSILLFSKADLVKNRNAARPVKTVHFEYATSEELCKGIAGDNNRGKLTLKKVWFTYSGNNKGQKNPYIFSYNGSNPSYNPKHYDRWGNYKDPATNPGLLSNDDYPYTKQDYAKAAEYAGAWNLTDIQLPSGGKMKVGYESDDYAFVQNKRAVQMTSIAGFGIASSTVPSNTLYTRTGSDEFTDHNFVFINSAVPLNNASDVYKNYLQGLEDKDDRLKIFFKIAVNMPYENDRWSTATKYELVPVYATVKNFGVKSSTQFWLELEPIDGKGVLSTAALQFLRLNLPSKAYPASETGNDVTVGQVVKTLASAKSEIENAVNGFDKMQKKAFHCHRAELNKSFVRLGSPDYRKFGGGLRVKRIEIYDNWNAMTGQKESVYGQEYSYTTSYVRGFNDTISISSGVASYEPFLGGEENIFHLPVEYAEQLSVLGPTNYLYTETPLGESFFPAAMVGYSNVRVRTINAKAKSANGWTETQYYTTREFPTLVDNTPIDKRAYNPKYNILKVNTVHHLTISQGFRIELNDMNGKLKSEAVYAENDSLRPIYYAANFYKVEDDHAFVKKLSNRVWATDASSGSINKQAQIGKEVEMMVDVREQTSTTLSGNLGVNIDFIPVPFPFPPFLALPSSIPLPQREESRFRSIAVTKIVQRYGILDSIVVMDKGSIVSTKNLVFDGETGQVLVNRTNNQFNDPVYSFNYPARWAYPGMGMAYENINLLLSNKKFKNGLLVETDQTPSPAVKYFESGDEIWLMNATKGYVISNPGIDCGVLVPLPTAGFPFTVLESVKKIWAIDASKGAEGHSGIYFIDENGRPYSGLVKQMRIIRSGKRNFTDAFVGSVTMLSNPVVDISDTQAMITIDENSKVVNATAATYKDLWNTGRFVYEKDSCYTIVDTATVILNPSSKLLMRQYKGFNYDIQSHSTSTPYLSASLKNYPECSRPLEINCSRTQTFRSKSIVKFDFSQVPTSASVITASLDLSPKRVSDLWTDVNFSNTRIADIKGYLQDKLNAHYVRESDALTRTNASILQRIKYPWGPASNYNNIGVYPGSVIITPTADDTCELRSGISVKDLIQPMITDPQVNFGLLMQLQDDGHLSKDDYQFRAMTFCAGEEAPFGVQTMGAMAAPPPSTCTDCVEPVLSVTFSFPKDTCVKICRQFSVDTANAYRWGMLGNWRTDQSIVYYSDRTESDASVKQTNLRTEGTLKNFAPYWSFTNGELQANQDETKWVCNATSSLYNAKGAETENFDALGRYNSGLYGYNQTLPVAVAQNSRYRDLLYDGFEDYGFQTKNCTGCELPREIDFLATNAGVAEAVSSESHTGRFSLQVNAGSQAVYSVGVSSAGAAIQQPALSVKVDSVPVYVTTVFGKGTGLSAVYSCTNGSNAVQTIQGPIDFNYGGYTEPFPAGCNRYTAKWTGKIQPRFSEVYNFSIQTTRVPLQSSGAGLTITDPANNSVVLKLNENAFGGLGRGSTSVALEGGKLYAIEISYPRFSNILGSIQMRWSSNRQQEEVVPKENLYPVTVQPADTAGSVITTIKEYCVKLNPVVPSSMTIQKFSPVANQKMIVGGWMKLPADCATVENAEGEISVSFDTGETFSLVKTGLPVESWQRYESEVFIPSTATQLSLIIKANEVPVLVDDIRVQPFNSNMKSFVYDPVSLRLMAELDENNYASLYEYDDDGTLVRVKKETEKGIQTIKETRTVLRKE